MYTLWQFSFILDWYIFPYFIRISAKSFVYSRRRKRGEADWHIKCGSDILHYSWWIISKNWRKCILCPGWWPFMYFFNIWVFYIYVRVEFLKFIFFRFFWIKWIACAPSPLCMCAYGTDCRRLIYFIRNHFEYFSCNHRDGLSRMVKHIQKRIYIRENENVLHWLILVCMT